MTLQAQITDFDPFASIRGKVDEYMQRPLTFNPLDFYSNIIQSWKKVFPLPFDFKKLDNDDLILSLALAGYSKSDVTVTYKDSGICIRANRPNSTLEDKPFEYVYNGLCHRNFESVFPIPIFYKLAEASLKDGVLTIRLSKDIEKEYFIEVK